MSSSSSGDHRRRRWVRARLPFALVTIAALAALAPAEAHQAVAEPLTLSVEGAPLVDVVTSGLTLTPAFSPTTTDYVLRCRPGVNTVGITLAGAGGTPIRAGSLEGPRVSSSVQLVENQALVVEAPSPTGDTTTAYWIRCLPSDFPALTVTRPGNPPPGWYLTGNVTSANGSGTYAMILDSNGTPVWYQKTIGQGAVDVTPVSKNVAAWASNPGPGFGTDPNAAFSVYDLSNQHTSRLRTPTRPLDFHDLLPLADGDYLLLATPLRASVDLRPLGFGRNQAIVDCLVEEVTAAGRLVWKWRSSDHVRPAESLHPDPATVARQRAYDVFHCNSVDQDPSTGDLLVSMRSTDAVYRIKRSTGAIMWKLGGNSVVGDGERHLVITNDPEKSFYGQHDARFQPGENVSLFDNHTWHVGAARGVEYHVDRKAGTAALVWEYRSPDDGHSTATGAFRRYAEGSDNLIAWGFKPRSLFTEVDARRKVLLNVALSGGDLAYRAVKTAPDQFDVDLLHSTAGLPAASFPVAPRVLSLGLETRDRSDRASVVITGTGLSGATDVKFGSAEASAVSVASDGLIKAVAPPGTESVAVTVTTPGGTSNRQSLNMLEGSDETFATGIGSWTPNVNAAVGPSQHVFRSAPSSLEVTPRKNGFCSVVTGRYEVAGNAALTGHAWARLGKGEGQMRTALVFYDDLGSVLWISQSRFRMATDHWVRLPVSATSPAGTSSVALAVDGRACETPLYVDDASLSGSNRFLYARSALTVASVGPGRGSRNGGTVVTITGGGFGKATAVRFGTRAAPSFTVTSDNSLNALAPPGSGTVNVTVATPAGVSPTRAPNLLAGTDSTFERGPGSWVGNLNASAVSGDRARTGNYSLVSKPHENGFQSVVSGAHPAAAGAVYQLSLWVSKPGTVGLVRPFIMFFGPSGQLVSIEQGPRFDKIAARGWTRLKFDARSPEGTTAVAAGIDGADGQADLYVDDVSLTGSIRFTYR